MIALVLQLALSNLIISVAVAVLAHVVDRTGRHTALAHGLWLLVLVKVLTPPLFMLPLVPGEVPVWLASAPAITTGPDAPMSAIFDRVRQVMPALLVAWALGSTIVLAVSLVRVRRFDELLRRTSAEADAETCALAVAVAARLGLGRCPTVVITSARISPLTWWTGRSVRVVIPRALCEAIDRDELRWVLAHELGHVKRRDHLVRWLEWVACVASWWNPVVWWARRSLRHDEEVSCDALVVERLDGRSQSYARALLTVVEFLAGPATRPPAVATGIDAGGRLERRFARIVAPGPERPMPRRLAVAVMGCALVLMTLGVGSASMPAALGTLELAEARSSILDAVDRGISGEIAGVSGGFSAPGSPPANVDRRPAQAGDDYAPLSGEFADRGSSRVRGAGGDLQSGHAGPDRLVGGRGRQALLGRGGDDVLLGGAGADRIRGGPGRDVVRAGRGLDTVHGGGGNDVIRTWRDETADLIDCGPGDADRAIVDAADMARDCEIVIVR